MPSDLVFIVVRRSASGDEWLDLATMSWSEQGARDSFGANSQKESRQFRDDNRPVRIVRRLLSEPSARPDSD